MLQTEQAIGIGGKGQMQTLDKRQKSSVPVSLSPFRPIPPTVHFLPNALSTLPLNLKCACCSKHSCSVPSYTRYKVP